MAFTNAQYALIAELLEEIHEIKDEHHELQTRINDVERENYHLRDRISELYMMINEVNVVDDVRELKKWMFESKNEWYS